MKILIFNGYNIFKKSYFHVGTVDFLFVDIQIPIFMKNVKFLALVSCLAFLIMEGHQAFAQRNKSKSVPESQPTFLVDSVFEGLKLRNIGPALMSGRIADIAIHPYDDNIWYVAVGSGSVWKTTNAGITWKPVFDDQPSYSIGCVAIDPSNPNTVWVGTGENVGGRHVGYGDGIYISEDGGGSWKNMGLKNSEHISKIIVHPDNSEIIYVAVQGPLWSKGGDRGFYKTIDGGRTWKKTLGDEEWTGVTDIAVDPRNPEWIYAATWQHHRNVAAYMGGGPKSGIHRSVDGGETWEKLSQGLPSGNMAKIGLAISPQQPDIIYAAIELDRRTGGLYRSTDRGASWEKRSDAISGATGPHYYQELYASPHQFDRIYLVDMRIQISDDGGLTFKRLKEENKHSDNHAIAFRADDPDYLLVGTDGGIYESFDHAENWRFMANLPVTQFYKVAVDDSEPFYMVYGGTQDNSTQGGPSRTFKPYGSSNADWFLTLFADGHQPATEPGNPDIMYSEWQQGNLNRIDRTTGEIVYIKPQPEPGEDPERFNWDAPILVSPHSATRLYFGSQRVWRSDNRGDSWTAISSDLTRNQERLALPIMGKTQSWDSPWDMVAMSTYNTVTSLAESPQMEGLIYAGTDDGLIQVTEDGGQSWRKIEVGSLPGVPATAFVNDIKADLFDANTVYVALDNHKFGDFTPYLFKSTDRGNSWQSIAANLPNRTLVWRFVQDHVKSSLMFLGTEFGIYFTVDSGKRWVKLEGGMPTISIRDLAIQKRESDLVAASFGRGFFILDDYSILRDVSEEQLRQEATLFGTRKALWYIEQPVDAVDSHGASFYTAPNPSFGAVFTYYLKEGLKTRKEQRQEKEKDLNKSNADIPFPGWEAIEKERREESPRIVLTVKNAQGKIVRKLNGPVTKGFHRIAWNLRYPATGVITAIPESNPEGREPAGFMAAPGGYTVSMASIVDGVSTMLSEEIPFEVVELERGALQGAEPNETAAFWRSIEDLSKEVSVFNKDLSEALDMVEKMKVALYRASAAPGELDKSLYDLRERIMDLDRQMNGDRARNEIDDVNMATISSRISVASNGTSNSTYGPTPMHKRSLEIARDQFKEIKDRLNSIISEDIPGLEKRLVDAGAPYVR